MTPPASAGLNPQALARLDAAFTRLIDARRLPGAVLMIVRHGQTALLHSLGESDPQRGTAMRQDAIFRIYSMTKPIVSTAAMMLVEQGLLQLRDPVIRYLPEFASARVAVERDGRFESVAPKRAMSVHDLLRHTAGFTYEFYALGAVRRRYLKAKLGSRDRTTAEQVKALAGLPLMHEPGTVWDYSRATDVLGRVVEVIAGRTLGEHLKVSIFDPLGMVDTGFAVPTAEHDRIAEPFDRDPDTGVLTSAFDPRLPAALQGGGGGLLSTAADYARFLELFLNGGHVGSVRLLGRKTVEAMTADHLLALPRAGDLLPAGHGFGLGFAVKTHVGGGTEPGSVGSYGWSGMGGTAFFVDPSESMFAVVLTQAPGQLDEVRELFRALVYAAIDD